MFRASETSVDVAELEGHELVDVVRPAVVLDPLVFWIGERGVDGHHRLEDFVVDRDGVACGGSDLFLGGRNRGDGITDVAHLLVLEGAFVLSDRKNAELHRQVCTRDHGLHAGNPPRRRRVDRSNARVRVRAAKDAAVQGAGEEHVVGVDRLARHARGRVNLR